MFCKDNAAGILLPAVPTVMPAVMLTVMLTVAGVAVAQAPVNRRYTETLLGPLPSEQYDSAVISPNGRRLASIEPSQAGQAVVVDGRSQKAYDRVAAPQFSPDSRWLAYAASAAGKWYLVVNQREQGPYDRVGPPVFSPNSRRLAHVALLPDGKRVVVVNNKPGKPYDEIFDGAIVFGGDGSRLAYGVRLGQQWHIVLDDQEGGPFDYLGSRTGIRFSPDGRRMAFAAYSAEKRQWSVVVDQQPQPAYENLGQLVFNGDGNRLAYAAMRPDGQWLVVVDGQEQKPYKAIGDGTLQFDPDGRTLVYAAEAGEKWLVVAGDHEGTPFDEVAEIRFSPDGRRLAYTATSGGTETVVLDGRPQRPFDRVGGGTLTFSRDGRRWGHIARLGNASFVVVDGRRNRRYDMVGYLTFTPDGAHYVYAATRGKEAFTVVDDQEAARRYEAIWTVPEARLPFDSAKRFHYLGLKQGNVYLVEEDVD
ncbi:MAG: PD40 domain-containing protein [Pirellulales bacterium]|nr:PD40 domain-containing protein [Pirellulales bacterium]